jgi:hypothetical protein
MTLVIPNPSAVTPDGQRARRVTDAVVSAYLNEIAGPARAAAPADRRAPRVRRPARSRPLRQRVRERCGGASAR